jgi:diadenosine tetraphosphate (Ap4A) HIT family hydrolase
MQPGNGTSCSFCQREQIARYILKETPAFRIVADHAPLVAGHVLIVPRQHYTCYGDMPAALDAELQTLKNEVRQFLARFYAAPLFWEHGIFRQTVYHAHLHCFPFGGEAHYDLARALHEQVLADQEALRSWHATHGHYFYLEDCKQALLFRADSERYQSVIQDVLRPTAAPYLKHTGWRSPQQRQEEGGPLIEEMIVLWQRFVQEGATHHDHSHTR